MSLHMHAAIAERCRQASRQAGVQAGRPAHLMILERSPSGAYSMTMHSLWPSRKASW
jgi:hypothetical protein